MDQSFENQRNPTGRSLNSPLNGAEQDLRQIPQDNCQVASQINPLPLTRNEPSLVAVEIPQNKIRRLDTEGQVMVVESFTDIMDDLSLKKKSSATHSRSSKYTASKKAKIYTQGQLNPPSLPAEKAIMNRGNSNLLGQNSTKSTRASKTPLRYNRPSTQHQFQETNLSVNDANPNQDLLKKKVKGIHIQNGPSIGANVPLGYRIKGRFKNVNQFSGQIPEQTELDKGGILLEGHEDSETNEQDQIKSIHLNDINDHPASSEEFNPNQSSSIDQQPQFQTLNHSEDDESRDMVRSISKQERNKFINEIEIPDEVAYQARGLDETLYYKYIYDRTLESGMQSLHSDSSQGFSALPLKTTSVKSSLQKQVLKITNNFLLLKHHQEFNSYGLGVDMSEDELIRQRKVTRQKILSGALRHAMANQNAYICEQILEECKRDKIIIILHQSFLYEHVLQRELYTLLQMLVSSQCIMIEKVYHNEINMASIQLNHFITQQEASDTKPEHRTFNTDLADHKTLLKSTSYRRIKPGRQVTVIQEDPSQEDNESEDQNDSQRLLKTFKKGLTYTDLIEIAMQAIVDDKILSSVLQEIIQLLKGDEVEDESPQTTSRFYISTSNFSLIKPSDDISKHYNEHNVGLIVETLELSAQYQRYSILEEYLELALQLHKQGRLDPFIIDLFQSCVRNNSIQAALYIYQHHKRDVEEHKQRVIDPLIHSFSKSQAFYEERLYLIRKLIDGAGFQQCRDFLDYLQAFLGDGKGDIMLVNPLKIAAQIIDCCTQISEMFPFTKEDTEDIIKQTVPTLCMDIHPYMLTDKTFDGEETVDMITRLNQVQILGMPKLDHIISNYWEGPYLLHQSFLNSSTAFRICKQIGWDSKSFDVEKQNRAWRTLYNFRKCKCLSSKEIATTISQRQHFFQYKVWEQSIQVKYFIYALMTFIFALYIQLGIENILQNIANISDVFVQIRNPKATLADRKALMIEYYTLCNQVTTMIDFVLYISFVNFVVLLHDIQGFIYSKLKREKVSIINDTSILNVIMVFVVMVWAYLNFIVYEKDMDQYPKVTRSAQKLSRISMDNDKIYGTRQLAGALCGILWLRVCVLFRLTRTIGPLYTIIQKMMYKILVFLSLLLLIFIIYVCIGRVLFYNIQEYKTTFNAFLFLFQCSMGEYTYEPLYKETEIPARYAKVYMSSFILINVVLMFNLLIAILTDTYTFYQNRSKGLYLKEIIYVRQGLRSHPKYDSFVSAPAPLNIFFIPLFPLFLCIRNKKAFNSVIKHLQYIPTALVGLTVFITTGVILIPFAYLMSVFQKVKRLFNSIKEVPFMLGELAMFTLLGIPILVVGLVVDLIIFIGTLFQKELKMKQECTKPVLLEYKNFITLKKMIVTYLSYGIIEIPTKLFLDDIRKAMNLELAIRTLLFGNQPSSQRAPLHQKELNQEGKIGQLLMLASEQMHQIMNSEQQKSQEECRLDLKQYNMIKQFLWDISNSNNSINTKEFYCALHEVEVKCEHDKILRANSSIKLSTMQKRRKASEKSMRLSQGQYDPIRIQFIKYIKAQCEDENGEGEDSEENQVDESMVSIASRQSKMCPTNKSNSSIPKQRSTFKSNPRASRYRKQITNVQHLVKESESSQYKTSQASRAHGNQTKAEKLFNSAFQKKYRPKQNRKLGGNLICIGQLGDK